MEILVTGYNMDVDREQVIKRQYLIHEKLLSACKQVLPLRWNRLLQIIILWAWRS